MELAVHARALSKRYGDFVAADGIDLDVPAGGCFGILGPNGAGKTTLMRMITCVSEVLLSL
jgi:lipooligosaccharide transport system ATP-binding protein